MATRTTKASVLLYLLTASILCSPGIGDDTVTPARPLVDDGGTSLISAGGSFELGFFSPAGSSNRYIGIWYHRIPVQTVVWVANRQRPVTGRSGRLSLETDGALVITDGENSTVIWSSGSLAVGNPVARLLDNGNFIVKEEGSDDDPSSFAWESFDFLTDTLLPGMKIGWNLTSGLNRNLTAWTSVSDPAPGGYVSGFDEHGIPQIFLWFRSRPYWRGGSWNGRQFSGVQEMKTNNVFNMEFVVDAREIMYSFYIRDPSIVSRLVMNQSGILQRLVWDEETELWSVFWLAAADLGSESSQSHRNHVVVIIVVVSALAAFFLLSVACFVWRRKKRRNRYVSEETHEQDMDLPLYDLDTIAGATGNFSMDNKLGEGGFGPVYKGKLGGLLEIAVKRLSKTSTQGLDEFKNEVTLIAKLQHRNLVRLLGCCIQAGERMLIYEYMPHGSLDFFLFDKDKDARTRRVVGTYGYMSPEYAMDGIFSVKSDVFSFGVLVLEIVSGKKNRGVYQSSHHLNLLAHIWSLWNEGKGLELADGSMGQSSLPVAQVMRCIKVGLLCVQERPEDRPTMSSVVMMLGGDSGLLPKPRQPGFIVANDPSGTNSSTSKQDSSTNHVSMTMLEGR
ncbi:hypothetical protein OPV22_003598 [Ensete ventricosum]|uniref:non-specific serine/threonine protein kinase n=1 Tax=Ensete ventricosum TaxID=4639 RepID=A0AAV8S1F1_ENSVE|nr:hypothetical protein OPV22_003598 [Ensete ventricosum]